MLLPRTFAVIANQCAHWCGNPCPTGINLEGHTGLEPAPAEWESAVLPLHQYPVESRAAHTREQVFPCSRPKISKEMIHFGSFPITAMAGQTGFEPIPFRGCHSRRTSIRAAVPCSIPLASPSGRGAPKGRRGYFLHGSRGDNRTVPMSLCPRLGIWFNIYDKAIQIANFMLGN